jgi:hypothetical protein
VEAILARNPGDFSHPMSVPVFLSNDNHFLAGIDASCTFDEMTQSVRSPCCTDDFSSSPCPPCPTYFALR